MAEHTVKAMHAHSLQALARVIKLDQVQLCCDPQVGWSFLVRRMWQCFGMLEWG